MVDDTSLVPAEFLGQHFFAVACLKAHFLLQNAPARIGNDQLHIIAQREQALRKANSVYLCRWLPLSRQPSFFCARISSDIPHHQINQSEYKQNDAQCTVHRKKAVCRRLISFGDKM